MGKLSSASWLVAALLLQGCSNEVVKSAATANPVATTEGITISGGASSEIADYQSLISSAEVVLASAKFEEALAKLAPAYPEVYVRPSLSSIGIGELAAHVRGLAKGTRRINTAAQLSGLYPRCPFNPAAAETCANEKVITGSVGMTGYEEDATMTIGRHHLARWRSGDPVERSCALNTMAHEITHTVSISTSNYTYGVIDGANRVDKTLPLASYLSGSVAQCVWLEGQGRLAGSSIEECVKVFGSHNFNSNRCNQFSMGQTVDTSLPNLATPANPL